LNPIPFQFLYRKINILDRIEEIAPDENQVCMRCSITTRGCEEEGKWSILN